MLLPSSTELSSAIADSGSPRKHSHAASEMEEQAAITAKDCEEIWVRRAQAGDVLAFEQIYRSHAARIYGLCLRLLQDAASAEDCVQETFINAWRHLARFEARASLKTWLHRIAVNVALARAPSKARAFEQDHQAASIDAVDLSDVGEQLDLEQALAQLPPGARHVLVLLGIYGHTHEEAAEMLGIAIGTCKAQLHRARQLLAMRLKGN